MSIVIMSFKMNLAPLDCFIPLIFLIVPFLNLVKIFFIINRSCVQNFIRIFNLKLGDIII